uniref:Uncharacterized protein n=1 Tax=Gloeochaete wittrockiana TaxID=38269 RepID=A0A3G1IVX4_9EUKA|nr:hypothetical protein [Gloeochaete wittrockiana]ASQ40207.1 hypothetical protein [Gloeochaete wittrockiana]
MGEYFDKKTEKVHYLHLYIIDNYYYLILYKMFLKRYY